MSASKILSFIYIARRLREKVGSHIKHLQLGKYYPTLFSNQINAFSFIVHLNDYKSKFCQQNNQFLNVKIIFVFTFYN